MLKKTIIYLQIFFYLGFVLLWFKDNFSLFRKVNLSYLIPLIPLIIITAIRIFLKIKNRRVKLRIKFNRVLFGLAAILLVAILVRVPFLVHNFGLLNSDDAISAVEAKHISEGKLPPIYYYGQHYMGTFSFHIYALMFKIFGYSVFLFIFLYILFYLGFIITQFLLFREIFSSDNISLVLSSFYCLPIGHLLSATFYVGANFNLVLFFGSLSIYLSFLIYKKGKDHLIPLLGFCLGISFWTHPITISFAICSFILIFLRFRFILKHYFYLMIYFLIGSFPSVLYELFYKFNSLKYSFSGTKIQGIPWDKIKAIIGNITVLISMEKNFLNFIYLFFIFSGIIGIIYLSFKRRKFLHENIFVIFFIIFLLIYSFSSFPINDQKLRYLYPFYFSLPFLLVSILNLLGKKFKYIFMGIMFLSILTFSNLKDTYESYVLVKRAHINLKKIIQTMEMTGERYWAGEFWQVILLTALSGERIIGWSYTREDYFPYRLLYFNQGENNNYVFFKEAGSHAIRFKEMLQHIEENANRNFDQSVKFIKLLDKLGVEGKKEKLDDFCWLVYDISGQFLPSAVMAPIPPQIPELAISKVECSNGELSVTFKNKSTFEKYRFRLHIEIPHYSSIVKGISSNKEEMKFKIPFPPQESFKIKYYLDYQGLNIPSTESEMIYCPSDQDLKTKRKKIMFLSGIGPWRELYGKRGRICEKEVNFEINTLLNRNLQVRLYLYSPFNFSHSYWYGDYSQEVRIEINGDYLTERRLEEGNNVIEFNLRDTKLQKGRNFLKLKFKYHLPFRFAFLWKTSVLMDKIDVD